MCCEEFLWRGDAIEGREKEEVPILHLGSSVSTRVSPGSSSTPVIRPNNSGILAPGNGTVQVSPNTLNNVVTLVAAPIPVPTINGELV